MVLDTKSTPNPSQTIGSANKRACCSVMTTGDGVEDVAHDGIFKSLDMEACKAQTEPEKVSISNRVDTMLQLREALNMHMPGVMQKQSTNDTEASQTEVLNQYEDTEEADEEFEVASIKVCENEEPNVSSGSNFARSALIAKLGVKSPHTPVSDRQGGSVSSKVFQDQLSARFKSRKQDLNKMTSVDSSDETYGA